MTTITFIGYGEAGGILADARAKENPVTVWDCKLNGPERDAMMTKANRGGVRAASSLADALTGAELIFSTVTAGSALDVASQAAPLMTDTQYFLDLNSVAPQTKRQAAERFKPGAYVDVAVMAPVPPGALRTPLLTGGPQAKAIAELLTALGCHARYGGDEVGSVS
ncbi:NAD(P)-binding domain-containing protein, partial [Escherichia coli]|uniref:NAD(P)-binding domain-containing protein n=1 Tax=Escherichia coli TaxID=562 RepID=UPI003F572E40